MRKTNVFLYNHIDREANSSSASTRLPLNRSDHQDLLFLAEDTNVSILPLRVLTGTTYPLAPSYCPVHLLWAGFALEFLVQKRR